MAGKQPKRSINLTHVCNRVYWQGENGLYPYYLKDTLITEDAWSDFTDSATKLIQTEKGRVICLRKDSAAQGLTTWHFTACKVPKVPTYPADILMKIHWSG
ncbi:MAG: hypothetical protein Ct9H300mP19_14750 [Dehalococcoidia bacterium]|nr:MAG: hypothetical protein Ct9H300mP19_14750 [Dehalococcoidia bacterium]